MKSSRRLRTGIATLLLTTTQSSLSVDTSTLVSSTFSPDCLEYRITGICYWLYCTLLGCSVETSVKVSHYVPDAVVSSYSNTGENPWHEIQFLSPPNSTAEGGGDGTTNKDYENNIAKFKNVDVVGHPGGWAFGEFVGASGYACQGAGTAYVPYFLSTFDTLAWRYNVPESVYPESLVPGKREIGSRTTVNLWGNVYPRGGFLHQTDDYKAGAVAAQRAGDIVTRHGQLHVYQPLIANARDGYWPAGALIESNASTGKWQELTPRLRNTCAVFPHNQSRTQAQQGDYAWALWRPYSCCQRKGQVFLGTTDFN